MIKFFATQKRKNIVGINYEPLSFTVSYAYKLEKLLERYSHRGKVLECPKSRAKVNK